MSTKRLGQSGHSNLIRNCQQLGTALCPSTRKWINCGTAIRMEYYLTIKRDELVIHTTARTNLNHYVQLKGARHKKDTQTVLFMKY